MNFFKKMLHALKRPVAQVLTLAFIASGPITVVMTSLWGVLGLMWGLNWGIWTMLFLQAFLAVVNPRNPNPRNPNPTNTATNNISDEE